jgi:hypothetical protein
MLFRSSSEVNKLVLLRRELHPMPSCLFKTALVNLAERSTVLFCAFTILLLFTIILLKQGRKRLHKYPYFTVIADIKVYI